MPCTLALAAAMVVIYGTNAFTPFWHGTAAFLSNYFLRGGIIGGVDGFTLALSIACNSYLKYAKLLEYQRDPKVKEAENFDNVW